jgi:hypothetical protein
MSFSADISKFIAKSKLKTEVVVKRIAFDAYKRVTLKTPVDTGRARANWLIGINLIPQGYSSGQSLGPSAISQYKVGDIIYIANNLPYIGVLEYGGYPNPPKGGGINFKGGPKTINGYSAQAPQGMVGVTMMEIQSNLSKLLGGV